MSRPSGKTSLAPIPCSFHCRNPRRKCQSRQQRFVLEEREIDRRDRAQLTLLVIRMVMLELAEDLEEKFCWNQAGQVEREEP